MPKTVRRGKPKKNRSLELLKAVTDSMSDAIGLDEEIPAHFMSGLASQYMGVDPDTGEVGETAWRNIKRAWNADERRKSGLPPEEHVLPGIVTDTLSLPNMFGNGPSWAKRAQRQADATHAGVRDSMGLGDPEGFGQVSADAMGTILGQLPMPAKSPKTAGTAAKDFLLAIPEYLSPTTEARVGNYITGGLGMGALDQAAQNPRTADILQALMNSGDLPQDPRIHVHNTEGDELSPGDYAKGGKASKMTEMLRAIAINPEAKATRASKQYMIGDPAEEILYAARQGVQQGKLTEEEWRNVIESVAHNENEENLEATLEALHAKLFPGKAMPDLYPMVPPIVDARAPRGHGLLPTNVEPLDLPPGPLAPIDFSNMRRPIAAPMGNGTLPEEEWNAMIERRGKPRAKGGKVKNVEDLLKLLPSQTTEQLNVKIGSNPWTKAEGRKLDVLKNPTSQADVERWAGRDVPEIRFMTTKDGDTYVWDANKAIHNQVMKALGLERAGLFHEMSDTPIPPSMFDQYFRTNPWE
jgi:hypothetical protein